MDGRGGCCIARYAGGAYDMSKMDRIMLRFRPIAPKPATGGSVSGGSTPENSEVYVKTGRCKRRYVRDSSKSNKKFNNTRKRKASPEETDPCDKTTSNGSVSGGETVVTLPLLPENPDRKESPVRESFKDSSDNFVTKKPVKNLPIWLSFSNNQPVNDSHVPYGLGHVSVGSDRTVMMMKNQPVKVVGSCVTVECVTDTWVDGFGLGFTDKERMMNLDRDTCPGFISDGLNRVNWVNGVYREMMSHGEVVVWLVMKDKVYLPVTYPAFTCRVRVTCGKERNSLTIPCDVWRMDNGGFAWRLDIKAALSLGL